MYEVLHNKYKNREYSCAICAKGRPNSEKIIIDDYLK
jgi:hypothetical protein